MKLKPIPESESICLILKTYLGRFLDCFRQFLKHSLSCQNLRIFSSSSEKLIESGIFSDEVIFQRATFNGSYNNIAMLSSEAKKCHGMYNREEDAFNLMIIIL